MRLITKLFLSASMFLAACGSSSAPADQNHASKPLTLGLRGDGLRPLSPSTLTFFHAEIGHGTSLRRTYIEVPDRYEWANIFGNVSFAFGDPKVAALSGNVSPPSVVVTSETSRLTSIGEVIDKIKQTGNFLRETDIRAYSQGLVFMFPNQDDFRSASKAIAESPESGLGKLDLIAQGCAYTRMQFAGGQRQAAILLMYTPRRSVDLANAADRTCFVGFLARNLGVSEDVGRSLIFPKSRLPVAGCEVARILTPGERSPPATRATQGCLLAPERRAEFIDAYAKAGGIGLNDTETEQLIRSVREACQDQIRHPELRGDDSCRIVLQGGE